MTDESIKAHESKTILTKNQFIELNARAARDMSQDQELAANAKEVLIKADKYRWVHQSSWMGEPLLNLPQDMFAIQDIIWRTKPEFIIEVGVAWGGGLLFCATLMEMLGGEKVIGVDIFMPDDLKARLASHGALSNRLELIEGSSFAEETLAKVKEITGSSRKVLVILDSFHTHEHVIKELRAYSQFVGEGQYLVCGDTIVDYIPEQSHRDRPWGPGNNPATAVKEFLEENPAFEVDKGIDERLLFSCHPGGYLKAIK